MILANCRLIPELCEGIQSEMADIRIEGDSIAEILPVGGHYIGEEVIDCTGKTVLPGLFNLHNHLSLNTMNFPTIRGGQTEYQHIINCIRYMHVLLAFGYTSLRDVGAPYNITIKLRDDINAGKVIGPDLKACGIILTPDHIAPPELEMYSAIPQGQPCNDPYLTRANARRQIAEGADFLKILGSSVIPNRRGGGSLFYPDEMNELVNVAKREGVYLAIHSNSPESNDIALDADAHTIEHCNFWTQENNDKWLARGKKSCLIPTLQVIMAHGEEACAYSCGSLRMAYDSGAAFGWGTDAPEEGFRAAPEAEFIARSKIWGIPNIEILKQATINSAKINGTDDLRGSIKVGKRADFAIIDGKPDEDLTLFGKPCAYVLKDGAVVSKYGFIQYA